MTSENSSENSDRSNRIFKHVNIRSHDPETNVFLMQSETTNESRLGVCFLAQPLLGADETTVNKLKSVLSTIMPAHTFIQIGRLNDPDVSLPTSIYSKSKMYASDVLWKLTQARVDMMQSGTVTPLPGMQDVLISRQRVVISMSVPCNINLPLDKQVNEFYENVQKLEEGFNTLGLRLHALDDKEYMALLRRFFHLYEPDNHHVDEYEPLREQVFQPGDALHFGDSEIIFNDGEYYARVLSIKEFPSPANLGLMNLLIGDPMSSTNQIKEPYWLSATIYYPEIEKKIAQFRIRHGFVIKQAFGSMTHIIPTLGYRKAGFDALSKEVDTKGGLLCEFNFTMTIFSKNKQRLISAISAQKAWAASYGFEFREDKRILKALFYSLLPMACTRAGIENMHRFKTMTVAHTLRFLPILGDWQGTGVGGSSILVARRGQPALFDPYDSNTNYNGVIAAGAGAGKSVMAQQLLCDLMAGGARGWVIDQGRSYQKLCSVLNGQFIEFSEESNICLNPFTFVTEIDDEMDLLKAIFSKMAAPDAGLDDYRLGVIEEKIKAAFSVHGQNADVTAVADQCLADDDLRIQDIGRQLYPYTRNGSSGRWFNGKNNVDLTNDFVVLELQELSDKKTLQQVVLLLLFASISHEMYLTHGRKKVLVIDEAWNLIDDPIMGKAIVAAYRKIRKHEGSAWLVTQSIADLYESPNGRPIIDNAVWQIILQQNGESIDRSINSKQLLLEPYEVAMLKSVHTLPNKYSELMLRQSGGNWGLFKLIIPRFAQILFSTKGWERDLILEKINEGANIGEFIEQLVLEGK
jgi:conjugal transfer ATP-binding protein TraC